jgi:hypothetical protein
LHNLQHSLRLRGSKKTFFFRMSTN